MRVAIFGTGDYCKRFSMYLKREEIVFYIDNDKKKQENYIDGKKIYDPLDAPYSVCDKIVVLVSKSSGVIQQLLELGIEKEKICTYGDIVREYQLLPQVLQWTDVIDLKEWLKIHKKKKVMCITHDLSRSGVPVLMLNQAVLLKEMGYDVLFAAVGDGNLREELVINHIDYITNIEFFFDDSRFIELIREFDFFWFGTIVLYKIVDKFAILGKPILWWIHESDDLFYRECFLPNKMYMKNIYLLAGGKRPLKRVQKQFPDVQIEELLYYLPEESKEQKIGKNVINKKIVFACIGAICKRKAQDILLEAVKQMSEEEVSKCDFVFAGPMADTLEYCSEFEKNFSLNGCVYKGELSQDEIALLYNEIDVLICPSRDDPMPLVVSQAMQNNVCCIISDQVGQTEFIVHKENGLVFRNQSPKELADCIRWMINNASMIKSMGEKARDIFESNFSKNIMKKNLRIVLSKIGL